MRIIYDNRQENWQSRSLFWFVCDKRFVISMFALYRELVLHSLSFSFVSPSRSLACFSKRVIVWILSTRATARVCVNASNISLSKSVHERWFAHWNSLESEFTFASGARTRPFLFVLYSLSCCPELVLFSTQVVLASSCCQSVGCMYSDRKAFNSNIWIFCCMWRRRSIQNASLDSVVMCFSVWFFCFVRFHFIRV